MSGRTKLILTLVAVLALATAGVGAMTLAGASQPSSPAAPALDVSGNCDEPEHAADPACAGAPTPVAEPSDDPVDDVQGDDVADDVQGDDVDGPCDEAEHANDPGCTGAQVEDRNDDADADHGDEVENEDATSNSGPSDDSGPGSTDSGHDGGSDD
jgi:hypothetical protein